MPDDVVLAKAESIERCVARVRDVYGDLEAPLKASDFQSMDVPGVKSLLGIESPELFDGRRPSARSAILEDDILRQDSILLNLQRACETSIDLAMHIVRRKRLGLPKETKQAFVLLKSVELPEELVETMKRMVGFRNIAVHRYRAIDIEIVEEIIKSKLDGVLAFSAFAVKHFLAN